MHKLLTAGVALLALGLSVPAQAADMPVKYVAPAPVFTWTGCYVGLHVGYKWGESKHTYGGTRNGYPDPVLPVGTDLTGNFDVGGPVGGIQGGCNYQTGNWVWGVEVDGGWASASGQAQVLQGVFPNSEYQSYTHLYTSDQRWLDS
jgi:outer membrane immunogenic protein